MKLSDIHLRYDTDKGTDHNYIEAYEALFNSFRKKSINLLEIGVLFGGSLKMWHAYFPNGTIYGIDDFSQNWSNEAFGKKTPDPIGIKLDLSRYDRIHFVECDSTNKKQVDEKIGSLEVGFDIIIDDGGHSLEEQLSSFKHFMPLMKEFGIYVIEDVQGVIVAQKLKATIEANFPGKNAELLVFDIENRNDDILMVVR